MYVVGCNESPVETSRKTHQPHNEVRLCLKEARKLLRYRRLKYNAPQNSFLASFSFRRKFQNFSVVGMTPPQKNSFFKGSDSKLFETSQFPTLSSTSCYITFSIPVRTFQIFVFFSREPKTVQIKPLQPRRTHIYSTCRFEY